MSHNPYQPPQNDFPVAEQPYYANDWQLASTGQRFANFMLDSIIRTILFYAVLYLFVILDMSEAAVFFSLPIMLLYYIVPELAFGRTPAKFITGTRVVSRDGSPLTFWRILGRTLSRFVPFEVFSFMNGPPGWHDTWSNTLVIKD